MHPSASTLAVTPAAMAAVLGVLVLGVDGSVGGGVVVLPVVVALPVVVVLVVGELVVGVSPVFF